MPDLRPAERYTAQLARVETEAARDALATWQRSRADLLDELSGAAPNLAAPVRAAGLQIGGQLRTRGAVIADIAGALVAAQIGDALLGEVAAPLLGGAIVAWEAAAVGMLLGELQRLQAAGADPAQILARLITGRDGRVSVYQQAGNALQLVVEQAVWGAGNGHVIRLGQAAARQTGQPYQKQVFAALDARTTACCRRAHGQIQDLDQPFVLTGTPRFADRVMSPPFHYRCRSAVTLYTPAMERIGPTTAAMRAQARA